MGHDSHDHGHGHGQHGHEHHHDHSTGVSDKGLVGAVILNVGLSVFEFIAGVIAGSSALMADALHNTNDAAALFIAWLARKISKRQADRNFTFGYRRAELIGAMIQLTALIVVGLFLVYEGIARFIEPEPLKGMWIIWASLVALVVDVATAWFLWAMSKGNLNVKAAFLHNLTDAGASVAVLLGGAAIQFLGWNWVDPLLTLIIAGYILYMSADMLRRTCAILMEGKPEGLDIHELQVSVEAVDGVDNLHHLHVWELDEDHRAMEAHIVIEDARLPEIETLKDKIKRCLQDKFDISHSTLEFELKSQCCKGHKAELLPQH